MKFTKYMLMLTAGLMITGCYNKFDEVPPLVTYDSKEAFEEALDQLTAKRPTLCPPGAWGCVSVVSRAEGSSVPTELTAAFLTSTELPAGAAVSAFAALALTAAGIGQNPDSIIIGALMALVPGIAFTNAMRDIMAGDMVAGISKAAEALLIGAAIALGTALALGLIRLLIGG